MGSGSACWGHRYSDGHRPLGSNPPRTVPCVVRTTVSAESQGPLGHVGGSTKHQDSCSQSRGDYPPGPPSLLQGLESWGCQGRSNSMRRRQWAGWPDPRGEAKCI